MVNGCHLITLRLDTALIDDVGRAWVVGGVVQPREPRQTLPGSLDRSLLVVALPLAGLACPAREAFLLVVSCFSGLILVLFICMLVFRRSCFHVP